MKNKSIIYHIVYQHSDGIKVVSFDNITNLRKFMDKEDLKPQDVWLIEGGKIVSNQGNKDMIPEFFKPYDAVL